MWGIYIEQLHKQVSEGPGSCGSQQGAARTPSLAKLPLSQERTTLGDERQERRQWEREGTRFSIQPCQPPFLFGQANKQLSNKLWSLESLPQAAPSPTEKTLRWAWGPSLWSPGEAKSQIISPAWSKAPWWWAALKNGVSLLSTKLQNLVGFCPYSHKPQK